MPVAAVPVVVVAWIELGLDLHLAYCLPVVVAYVAVVLDVVVVTCACGACNCCFVVFDVLVVFVQLLFCRFLS